MPVQIQIRFVPMTPRTPSGSCPLGGPGFCGRECPTGACRGPGQLSRALRGPWCKGVVGIWGFWGTRCHPESSWEWPDLGRLPGGLWIPPVAWRGHVGGRGLPGVDCPEFSRSGGHALGQQGPRTLQLPAPGPSGVGGRRFEPRCEGDGFRARGCPAPPSSLPLLASRPLRVHGRRCCLCRPAASGGMSRRWFHCRSWNGKGRAAWPARTARGTVTASAFCLGGHAGVACSSGPSRLPRRRLRGGRGRTGEWHSRLPAGAGAEILPMVRGPGEAARPPAASCLRAPGLVRGVRGGVRATDSQRGGRGHLR